MPTAKSAKTPVDGDELRRQAGARLKFLRKERGLDQPDLVDRLKFGTQGFYSQIETGRRRMPPALYEAYAEILEVDCAEFMKMLLRFNEPAIYSMMFGDVEPTLGLPQSKVTETAEAEMVPMADVDPPLSTDILQDLRREGGEELQAMRQAKGLSQRELAKLLNLQETSFVSQIETGRRAPPADKYVVYAHALDVDSRDFIKRLMKFYDPFTYKILFGDGDGGALAGDG